MTNEQQRGKRNERLAERREGRPELSTIVAAKGKGEGEGNSKSARCSRREEIRSEVRTREAVVVWSMEYGVWIHITVWFAVLTAGWGVGWVEESAKQGSQADLA